MEGITVIAPPQKTFPKMSERDQQFEKLLSNVFQMLSAQQQPVRIDTAGSKLHRKAQ